jgi:DNA-binding FadR family transcriptional regulator
VSVSVRPPAYQVLADSLREQITSGHLRPGDRLPTEPQLCASTGVSRSTVREALRLLASQNLFVTTRGVTGGSCVAHPSPDHLSDVLSMGVGLLLASNEVSPLELMQAREMIEVPAAGIAALNHVAEHLDGLRAGLFDPINDSVETMVIEHRVFHLALAKATGNAVCELISRPLYPPIDAGRRAAALPRHVWVRIDAEHRDIIAAIASRNASAAEAAARRHLAHLRAALGDAETAIAALDGTPVSAPSVAL